MTRAVAPRPQVSVVVLTHNKLEITRRCLPSLVNSTHRAWELIVVDNGSDDGTVEWSLAHLDTLRRDHGIEGSLIRLDRNAGCSTARNHGLGAARAPYVAFLDNDVAVRTRAWMEILVERLGGDARIAAAGPKLVYPTPPYAIQCAGVAISPHGRVQFRGRGEPRETPEWNRSQTVQCLISACVMFRRSVLRRIGGFDEAFNPVEFEDFDLCYRARAAGLRVVYTPAAEMYHWEGTTTTGTPSLGNTRLIIENGMVFKQRWRHCFEREGGPPEAACKWRALPPTDPAAVGDLPLV